MTLTITPQKVVGFHYVLTNADDEILDRSDEALEYLHGFNNIIPGLEKELDGLAIGDKKTVSVPAADAYGEYDDSLIHEFPKSAFTPGEELEVGLEVELESDQSSVVMLIKEIGEDTITLDGNHPLAGETLNFDVEIASIREATKEELEHGHVHSGDGDGHHHH